MTDIKKNIVRVFWFYIILFVCIIIFIIKLVAFDSESIIINSYNKRISIIDNKIIRGEIKDDNGNVLARTAQDKDTLERVYPFNERFAHVVGYTTFGKLGAESSMNFSLQKLHFETFQRVKQFFTDDKLIGNNIILTLNNEIQQIAFDTLGEKKGAVIVLEPSTGKILACVSYPTFNPNNINDKWFELNANIEESPLLNRATKGLYPPGSTFKIVTASAMINNLENWQDYKYTCSGRAIIDDKDISCFDGTAHGDVDLYKAMAVSCNTFFATVANDFGATKLREASERFYFNESLEFSLDHSLSSVTLSESSTLSELIETSIGQGKTLSTPLHMAMIASAVANNGILMKPYLLNYEQFYNSNTGNKRMPEMLDAVLTVEEASIIKEMLIGVVNEGTGTAASIPNVQVAGKTGTAENSGLDHSWFIGFAPADNPEIAIAVILENAEKGNRAAPIAGYIIKESLEKLSNMP